MGGDRSHGVKEEGKRRGINRDMDGWVEGLKDEGGHDNGCSMECTNQVWRERWILDGRDMLFNGKRMDKYMETNYTSYCDLSIFILC